MSVDVALLEIFQSVRIEGDGAQEEIDQFAREGTVEIVERFDAGSFFFVVEDEAGDEGSARGAHFDDSGIRLGEELSVFVVIDNRQHLGNS